MDYRPDATMTSTLEAAAGGLGLIPGVSTLVSAGNTLYHGGSAIYDGVTGDRDGAIAHGTQAAISAVSMIPGVPDLIGQVDAGLASHSAAIRMHAESMGLDPTQIPTGFADMASFAAVAGTNAIFGADDSNWIADGDKPTGTRGGEIAAGAKALGTGMFGAIDLATDGKIMGSDALIAPMQGIAEFFGSDLNAPTSGARAPDGSGSYAQKVGDHLHNEIHNPGFEPPMGPALPVLPDELRY